MLPLCARKEHLQSIWLVPMTPIVHILAWPMDWIQHLVSHLFPLYYFLYFFDSLNTFCVKLECYHFVRFEHLRSMWLVPMSPIVHILALPMDWIQHLVLHLSPLYYFLYLFDSLNTFCVKLECYHFVRFEHLRSMWLVPMFPIVQNLVWSTD